LNFRIFEVKQPAFIAKLWRGIVRAVHSKQALPSKDKEKERELPCTGFFPVLTGGGMKRNGW
jgi:hypothetical protein